MLRGEISKGMSSGEVLISELFVSRRKEREEVAGRTVRNNGDSGKSFGNTVSRILVESVPKKKKSPLFLETTIVNIRIEKPYIF